MPFIALGIYQIKSNIEHRTKHQRSNSSSTRRTPRRRQDRQIESFHKILALAHFCVMKQKKN